MASRSPATLVWWLENSPLVIVNVWDTSARQYAVTFSDGGSGPGYGAQRSRVAAQVFSSGIAARAKDRQSRHGETIGGAPILDVAQRMGLRAVKKVRSVREPDWNRRWCDREHRVIDWAARSPGGEFELAIMIELRTEEMHGSD